MKISNNTEHLPHWYDFAHSKAKEVNFSLKNSFNNKFFKAKFNQNLCGTCAIGSATLAKLLAKHNANLVRGIYSFPDGFITDHCWVEIDGFIIDCTYSQFSFYENIKICKVNSILGKRYKKTHIAEKAKKDLRSWTEYQSPKFWKYQEQNQIFVYKEKYKK